MLVTATIHRNFRDTTSQPKVLLTDLEGLNRDHTWVELTPSIEKVLPRTNRTTRRVQFNCDMIGYTTIRTNSNKLGLRNIANISII